MRGWLRAHLPEALFLLLLLSAALLVGSRLRIETSMAPLLPPATRELSQLAQQVIESNLASSMVLSVGPRPGLSEAVHRQSSERAMKVARSLARTLEKSPEVRWVKRGPEPKLEAAFRDLYFERRFNFVASDPKTLSATLAPEGLDARLEALERSLAGPTGPLVRKLAPEDPLSLFLERLERVKSAAPQRLDVNGGQFVSEDGHAIIFVGLQHSALDGTAQKRLLDQIETAFDQQRAGAELVLERSGVNLFAVDSEARITSDISRVAVFSTLGIVLVFLALFRRLGSLLSAFLPLGTGFLMALAACTLVFQQVHGLTLAFGASLLGVCIDYPVHLMNHRGVEPSEPAKIRAKSRVPHSVRRGLTLGAVTTVLGISALAFSGFRVMQQVAVFSGVGLLSALAVTLFILPRWPDRGRRAFRRQLALALASGVTRLKARRSVLAAVCALPALAGAAGLARASWADSLEGLAPLDQELRAEDGRVRARVGAPGSNDLVLAVGSTQEEALANNERAFRALRQAQDAGAIKDFRSLHALLWSSASQERSFRALTAPEHARTLLSALEEAGFEPASFAPYFQELRGAKFRPLTLSELQDSALGPWVQQFALEEADKTLLLSFPSVGHTANLAQHLQGIQGVHFIDQRQLLNQAYSDLRQRVSWLMLLGGCLMATLVFVRFRRLRTSLATLAPAAVAPVAALGILGLSGQTLNLFHLFAALVVLSMAMDYGIFLSEVTARETASTSSASWTLLSILIAATTTCLSFGLLGFSSVPVLEAIGQTVALGIVCALVAAPLTLLFQSGELSA